VRAEKPAGWIGARFHQSVAALTLDVCRQLRERTGIVEVALSGGVWQNRILFESVRSGLEDEGFTVYFHKQTPTNDGGISLGQAVIANSICSRDDGK
jgi:hydrogenase maturation protein HypF